MTSVSQVIRRRRRRLGRAGSLSSLRTLALTGVTGGILLAGIAVSSTGRELFSALTHGPAPASLEALFGSPGSERFHPAQLFDRTGSTLLAEAVHPLATGRRWQPLDALPVHVAQAVVAAVDPDFWSRPETDAWGTLGVLASVALGRPPAFSGGTIPERLAEALVAGGDSGPALERRILAAELGANVAKARLLDWYLNSADFGNLAFGIDAAALVYFGVHADELTLAQASLLAGMLQQPSIDPTQDPRAARALASVILDSLVAQGEISASQAAAARQAPFQLREGVNEDGPGFVQVIWEELVRRVGAGVAAQGGLRVITTIDLGLQLQVDCVVRTQIARMNAGDPAQTLSAADGSPCVAAALLPPIRPGDTGVDHGLVEAAVVVLDPESGEILAVFGPASDGAPAGTLVQPFVYLSAFSRGYTPGSMIVDGDAGGRGPMRMRTALASADRAAAGKLASEIGSAAIGQTMANMGLEATNPEAIGDGSANASLLEMTTAFGILANSGVLVGGSPTPGQDLASTSLREVWGADGRLIASPGRQSRAILSVGLAFLMNDILSDRDARSEAYGIASVLDPGRPAAALVGLEPSERVNWTIGYVPQRVVGAWVAAPAGGKLVGVGPLAGSAPVWQAVLRYAAAGVPAGTWSMPADVRQVDVCDPSGYLPTPYCPSVVHEVFLTGTEPTHADTLYRPMRINRETDRLATFFTPLDSVEERVYFLPPPEAAAWASASGVEAPPSEYDRMVAPAPTNQEVRLTSPTFLATIGGVVEVRGTATGADFAAYRLYAGSGLDPLAWIQIGAESRQRVVDGLLGRWDTAGLDGAYILRLAVESEGGSVQTAALALTVDNRAPSVSVVFPLDGATFRAPAEMDVPIQVEVADSGGVSRVVILVDGRWAAELTDPPWTFRWPLGSAGEHSVAARATDAAGNSSEADVVRFRVER